MDYRERCYYLIDLNSDKNNDKINLMKQIAPSMKIHAPINHFSNKNAEDKINVANKWFDNTAIHCTNISCLVSVRKVHNYFFKKFLTHLSKGKELFYFEVDKHMLGQ